MFDIWKSERADDLSNSMSCVTAFEAVTLSVQVKSSTPHAFKTTLNVIFTLNCQSHTHRETNMERQFCKRFSQWTIIVGDYLDLKQWDVWVRELEYAVIQPPTGKGWKVISILKEIKMKKTAAVSAICSPISFIEIRNLGHSVGTYRTVKGWHGKTSKPSLHNYSWQV